MARAGMYRGGGGGWYSLTQTKVGRCDMHKKISDAHTIKKR